MIDDMEELMKEHGLGDPEFRNLTEEHIAFLEGAWESVAESLDYAGKNKEAAAHRQFVKVIIAGMRMGLWATTHREMLEKALGAINMQTHGELSFLSEEECEKLKNEATKALETLPQKE